jgi:hypothetical protein
VGGMRKKRDNEPINIDEVYDFSDEDIPKIKIKNPTLTVSKNKIRIVSTDDSNMDVHFTRKKDCFLQCNFSGHMKVKSTEETKCDLGHYHFIETDEKYVYENFELTRHEALQLAKWLFEQVKNE